MNARESEVVACKIKRYSAAENIFVEEDKLTSVEIALEVFLNGEKFSVIFCSPGDLEDLIIGILAQAGKIRSIEDVTNVTLDTKNFVAEVTTAPRNFLDFNPAQIFEPIREVRFVAKDILDCADELLSSLAVTHVKTNGVHCGAIFDQTNKKILAFREDIGRHNVFDKLCGWSIRNRVDLSDKILIFSGRCSCDSTGK